MKLKKENSKKINEKTTDMIDISKPFTFGMQREAGQEMVRTGLSGTKFELMVALLNACESNEDIKEVMIMVSSQLMQKELINIVGKLK